MIRILFFLFIVFALGLGFAWLADRPGDMVVTFNGYQYQVSLMVAAVAVTALVAAVMIAWWLVKSVWNSPYTISRYFRVRRRDRGYQALSTGMIAAGAGDASLARKKSKEAAKLINSGQEPLIQLLDAQTALLEGDHDGARAKFEAMLDDPELRLLALRGLYLEAERLGDRTAARHYAGRAVEAAPQLGWASEATLEQHTEEGDWDGALRLLDAQKSTGQIERATANRRRAVLLTAKAMAALESDPLSAKNSALEANRLAPDLVPAAVTAARALFRQDDVRKGAKILETIWKSHPHPHVADAYVHARPGDATHDRLERAKRLQSLKQNHAESALTVARAALDAGEFRLARAEAESALRMDPREGTYLLLADIEEADTADQGRIRQLLGQAVRAPGDPAWVADGHVSERWLPVSPITGKLDAFEWRVAVEKIGRMIDQGEPAPKTGPAPALVAPTSAEAVVLDAEPVKDDASVKPVQPVPPLPEPSLVAADPALVADTQPKPDAAPENVSNGEVAQPIRLPDDPGVETETETSRRFRLF